METHNTGARVCPALIAIIFFQVFLHHLLIINLTDLSRLVDMHVLVAVSTPAKVLVWIGRIDRNGLLDQILIDMAIACLCAILARTVSKRGLKALIVGFLILDIFLLTAATKVVLNMVYSGIGTMP